MALKGAPGIMNGLFTIPEGKLYRKNQMDFTDDRFQVTVPLFNIGMSFHQSILKRNSVCKKMLDTGVFFQYYANSQCMRYHLQMFSSVLGKN